MWGIRLLPATLVVIATLLQAEVQAAHLRGDVSVGFHASGGANWSGAGGLHYRVGKWVPIRIRLYNDDGDMFTGFVEARQQDRDGDEIVSRLSITFREDTDVFLYVPGGPYRHDNQFTVQVIDDEDGLAPLFDDNNEPITALGPKQQVIAIAEGGRETRVLLDVSRAPLGQLNRLPRDELNVKDLMIARAGPMDLPNNPAGFDMADTVVWDSADPSEVRDPQCVLALIEWVRRGGTLVLGVGRNWDKVKGFAELEDVLPARLQEATAVPNTETLPGEVNDRLFGDSAASLDLDPAINISPILSKHLRPGATSVLPTEPGDEDRLLITRRPCGLGAVVLVATDIRQFLDHHEVKNPDILLRQALSIRRFRNQRERDNQDQNAGMSYMDVNLFGQSVEPMISFQLTAAWYFIVAFLFVSLYILIVTFGSWGWLKSRAQVKHAWVVFASLTLAASGVSLAAVRLVRGGGQDVQECSIVDGRAGSQDVASRSYFGLKTSSHALLDLSVPTNWLDPIATPESPASLAPLPPSSFDTLERNVYAASKRYVANVGLGELYDVPFRATLKQFEAFWQGQMNGRISASLDWGNRSEGRLSDSSYIRNDLGTDLSMCCLILARDTFSERVHRPSRWQRMHYYPIGDLSNNQRILLNAALAREVKRPANADRSKPPDVPMLSDKPGGRQGMHGAWLREFARQIRPQSRGMGDERTTIKTDDTTITMAMQLFSTMDEVDPDTLASRTHNIRRGQAYDFDCSLDITQDTALFIGYSTDPGPARLCTRKSGTQRPFRAIEPERAWVMYRIRIPIGGS